MRVGRIFGTLGCMICLPVFAINMEDLTIVKCECAEKGYSNSMYPPKNISFTTLFYLDDKKLLLYDEGKNLIQTTYYNNEAIGFERRYNQGGLKVKGTYELSRITGTYKATENVDGGFISGFKAVSNIHGKCEPISNKQKF